MAPRFCRTGLSERSGRLNRGHGIWPRSRGAGSAGEALPVSGLPLARRVLHAPFRGAFAIAAAPLWLEAATLRVAAPHSFPLSGESMTAEIRAPRRHDLPSLFECVRTYEFHLLQPGGTADPGMPEDAILSVRNRIVEVDLRQRCWIAVEGSTVLGFCCWGWLDEVARQAKTILICVRPEARKSGLGSQLQERRMLEMREQGARELHTWSVDP